MLSSGALYHLGQKVIIWDETLSSGTNVISWDYMLSSGTTCYHQGCNVIIWSYKYVIIWYKMLSSGANVIMVSSGANVIIWCYHVMLSSGMITHPFFIFPENFTHSCRISWSAKMELSMLEKLFSGKSGKVFYFLSVKQKLQMYYAKMLWHIVWSQSRNRFAFKAHEMKCEGVRVVPLYCALIKFKWMFLLKL